MPGAPAGSRGAPAFDQTALDAIAAARGQQRHWVPPELELPAGYQRAELTDEERAEIQKAADDEARTCKYCLAVHKYPTTIGCPRIAEAELDGDGKIRRVRFYEGMKWKDRVALVEDLAEEASDGS